MSEHGCCEASTSISPLSWYLGSVNPKKVIHRANCRYARWTYHWANEHGDVDELARALVADRADGWHRACLVCSADLDIAILDAYVDARLKQEASGE